MAVHAIVALRAFLFHCVEESSIVRRPGKGSGFLHALGIELARLQTLDVERVLAEASVVGGIGQQIAVFTHAHAAQRHEFLTFGESILIKDDFFGRVSIDGILRCPLATEDRVLLSGFRAGVIEVVAFAERDTDVRFLDVADHLPIELFLKSAGMTRQRVGVGVLGLEIARHFRIVLVAKPEIVVDPSLAVDHIRLGSFLRNRRLRIAGFNGESGIGLAGHRPDIRTAFGLKSKPTAMRAARIAPAASPRARVMGGTAEIQ